MKRIVRHKAVEKKESMLDFLAREGARKMLAEALEEEVTQFLGRRKYERDESEQGGYRNGTRARTVTVLGGTLKVPYQKVAGVDYRSSILAPYQRRSEGVDELFRRLLIEGLSTRDFEPALRALIGDGTTLSASTLQRLAAKFGADLAVFNSRDLSKKRYAYVWADAVYLKAGLEGEKTALLVLVGVNEQGHKELIALMEGYRESHASWKEVLRGVEGRGLIAPLMVIGDGIPGLWKALAEVYPTSKEQRCWIHKMRNVVDKVPKAKQEEILDRLRVAYQAESRSIAEQHLALLAEDMDARYPQAAECVRQDQEALLRYFDFPKAHHRHLKTTNPIESIFAGVRLRTYVVRRFQKARNGVAFVYKIVERLAQFWVPIEQPQLIGKLWVEQEKLEKVAA
jgi:putative transposase